jgi:hypothetical protein
MSEKQVNRVPVVDGDKLVGVVTRGDVLRGVGGLAIHEPPPPVEPVIVGAGISAGDVSRRDR